MPKSARQLDHEIAEALQRRKRFAKALQGKTPMKNAGAQETRSRAGATRSATKTKQVTSNKAVHSTKVTKGTKVTKVRHTKHRATTKKGARVEIERLIASADPDDWNVARDLALEKSIEDLIVLLDMSRALDVAPSELEVTKGRPYNKAFEVSLGNQEYVVVLDEDTAEKLALKRVTEDLKDEPGMFNPSLIEGHIDQKKLKKLVFDSRMEDDYVEELARHQVEDFWQLARQLDVDKAVPDTDEDGELMEPNQKQIKAVKKAYAESAAKDPMEYFEDMYGREEAAKHAVKAVGFDTKAAAEEAVNSDGWQHYLAGYDGNSHETDSGRVYWRTN